MYIIITLNSPIILAERQCQDKGKKQVPTICALQKMHRRVKSKVVEKNIPHKH